MGKQLIIYINGYGTPKDPLADRNYMWYLGAVLIYMIQCIEKEPDLQITVYLAGGFTNRQDLSEAEAMHMWFDHYPTPSSVKFEMIENTTSAQENLQEFKRRVGDKSVVIFCEYTRQRYMHFFAERLFSNAQVVGVKFDERSLQPQQRLLQLIRTVMQIGAFYSPLIHRFVRQPLRKLHVARERKKHE